jgi:hypothetical protein
VKNRDFAASWLFSIARFNTTIFLRGMVAEQIQTFLHCLIFTSN